ncbi:hypothetical protein [Pseudonocardia acaciae]|uniref:hypothetical protein n=1 Tax=Pseudonocardia acaciae TaxID=551276 RepID=UPI00048CEF71|nr:hypothetical protein [Pseudonocardia acaciae]
MGVPPELDRKVRQLDNDVQAIYVMLADISATQRRQGMRMEEIAGKQDELASTQAEQGVKLDQLAAKQTEQAVTLAEHGAMLTDHGKKLDTIIELLRSNAS